VFQFCQEAWSAGFLPGGEPVIFFESMVSNPLGEIGQVFFSESCFDRQGGNSTGGVEGSQEGFEAKDDRGTLTISATCRQRSNLYGCTDDVFSTPIAMPNSKSDQRFGGIIGFPGRTSR